MLALKMHAPNKVLYWRHSGWTTNLQEATQFISLSNLLAHLVFVGSYLCKEFKGSMTTEDLASRIVVITLGISVKEIGTLPGDNINANTY